MHFLGCPGLITTSMSFTGLLLFANLAEGIALEVNCSINGHNYKMGYYDGIYPLWSTLMSISLFLWGTRENILPECKNRRGRMLKEILGVFSLSLPLFDNQLVFGTQRRLH